jgi:hypothetical protein
VKNVILVAGFDYTFKGINFRGLAENRMRRLVNANVKQEELWFTIIDFAVPDMVTHTFTYAGGKQKEAVVKRTPSSYRKVSKSDYEDLGNSGHYTLKEDLRGFMPPAEVYAEVQRIGRAAERTLMELSFFTHGHMGGPIIYNSFDDGQYMVGDVLMRTVGNDRDPDDFDPRIKDFSPPNMSPPDLAAFRRAFPDEGFVWLWGCVFPQLTHELLTKIENNPAYRDSGLGPEVIFRFTNLTSAQSSWLLRGIPRTAFGGGTPDPKNFEVAFKYLKHFFCQQITATYSHHMAYASDVKTFAAVVGTYSQFDTNVPLPLMNVYPGFSRHFAFYRNYLGFAFDPEGRNYGLHKPAFVCFAPTP